MWCSATLAYVPLACACARVMARLEARRAQLGRLWIIVYENRLFVVVFSVSPPSPYWGGGGFKPGAAARVPRRQSVA